MSTVTQPRGTPLWACALAALLASCDASLVAYDQEKGPGNDEPPTDGVTTPGEDGGDDDDLAGDDDDDTTPPLDPIDIELVGVTPWYGTVGHEVTLTGGPFPPDTVIRFGAVDASIVDLRDDEVTVTVPDLGTDAVAEITASSVQGESPAPLDFLYFEDGTGRIGAIGTVDWYDYRGGYWASPPIDTGFAQVMLSVPTSFRWEEILYAGTPDTCERDWSLGITTYVYDPGVSNIVLSAGPSQLVLPSDPDQPFVFLAADLPVQTGASYNLQPISGNPTWPSFGVQGLSGVVPTTMVVTEPNVDATAPPPVPPGFTIRWNGPYAGDSVLVFMQRVRVDASGNQVLQDTVSCWLTDDGFHIVPQSVWSDWDTATDYVYLSVGRASKPQNVILPHNNARSDVTGVYWSVGFLDAD